MFKKFAEEVGKAHTQLMEGAITYAEFFNYTAVRVLKAMEAPGYTHAQQMAAAEQMGEIPPEVPHGVVSTSISNELHPTDYEE